MNFIIEDGVLKEYKGKAEHVIVPDGVTSIDDSAFRGCDSIKTVTIPASVVTIGDYALKNIFTLTSINVAENNASYLSIDGVLFDKNGTTLIVYPRGKTEAKYIIPDGVEEIAISSFSDCNNLVSIIMPNSVKSIDVYAFWRCKNIVSIDIPESVTSICRSAFDGCESLSSINVDENNLNYKTIDGVLFNKKSTELLCFPYAKNSKEYPLPNSITKFTIKNKFIEKVIVPGSVIEIGSHTFYECDNLKKVILENGVKYIYKEAFDSCTSLEELYIPMSVEKILVTSIVRCKHSLEFIYVPEKSKIMEKIEKIAVKVKAELVTYKAGESVDAVLSKKNNTKEKSVATAPSKTNMSAVSSVSEKKNNGYVAENKEKSSTVSNSTYAERARQRIEELQELQKEIAPNIRRIDWGSKQIFAGMILIACFVLNALNIYRIQERNIVGLAVSDNLTLPIILLAVATLVGCFIMILGLKNKRSGKKSKKEYKRMKKEIKLLNNPQKHEAYFKKLEENEKI